MRTPFPYVDGLCFWGTDADVQASGLSAFICDVSAHEDGTVVRDFAGVAAALSGALASGGRVFVATTGDEVRGAWAEGRTAAVLQVQGCDCLEGQLERIHELWSRGLRVLQVTHHRDNAFGGGCLERWPTGLTSLGVEAVERMNGLGVIPDVSHASSPTALDVVRVSKRPVIVSHTGPAAIVNHPRCASDDVLRAVAASGGVAGLFMMSFWVTDAPVATADAWVQSLRHMVKVAGIEHVGVANDFPLAGERRGTVEPYLPWWAQQAERGVPGFERPPAHVVFPEFNHLGRMDAIHDALARAGFSGRECELVLGGNWLRVLGEELR
jgi:microsomal dipeptidase-like Zn-dependent dipeptidase